ncbi:MAG: prephenate dehydratase [Hespellia sp.]|nr:prephenate dehydratase [Hespellia sp.]
MYSNDIEEIRDELDEVDVQILRLYEERMRICRELGTYKIERGQKMFDKQRERDKLSQMVSLAQGEFDKKATKELFEQFMAISRKMQYQMLTEKGALGRLPFIGIDELDWSQSRIVYQGTEGAYSQEALKTYFGHEVNSFSAHTFRDAMEAIEEGSADFAVLPIENSTAGAVDAVFDLLVEFENYIVDDIILPIHHALAVYPGTTRDQIQKIYSHPQALMQSARFLEEHRDWQQISVVNTALAAKKVLDEKDQSQAAICSEYAAQIHGLEVMEHSINDNPNNSTRFIIVTNQKVFLKNAKKISICFEVAHESGSLYHLLSHFIYNNLNMTKIESRPIEGQSWEYRFFVDFDGNMADPAVKNAIRGLREEARNLKILGNY